MLGLLGLTPEVVPAQVDETLRVGEAPTGYAQRLALEKAAAVRRNGAAVIGADTIVVLDGAILGKPRDAAEAAAMLGRLSGREHLVHTAIAVTFEGRVASGVETTRVWFRPLDDRLIAEYVATGDPLDKAGSYGIQGYGALIVERIEGDFFTVMGLGLGRLVALLGEVGVRYRFGALTRVF
ncbi:MAG: septum formation protein Maf [Gemmatimonadetes bacterium]|nr:septum formation protein Maf [Gemmatimonadota bacterium]